jgi:hypothetical protein
MGQFEKDLTRVSVWWGPQGTQLSHVPYRDMPDSKLILVNDEAILLLNNFLFQQKEPPTKVHVTVEWE